MWIGLLHCYRTYPNRRDTSLMLQIGIFNLNSLRLIPFIFCKSHSWAHASWIVATKNVSRRQCLPIWLTASEKIVVAVFQRTWPTQSTGVADLVVAPPPSRGSSLGRLQRDRRPAPEGVVTRTARSSACPPIPTPPCPFQELLHCFSGLLSKLYFYLKLSCFKLDIRCIN